jgi:hypothetical protein
MRGQRVHTFKFAEGFFAGGFIIVIAFLPAGMMLCVGCLPKVNFPQYGQSVGVAPSRNVLNFINNAAAECASDLLYLDIQSEPGSGNIIDTARALWRRARSQYEMMRFAAEEFTPVYHQQMAAWFTPVPPTQGFHYMEKLLFGADSSDPQWSIIEGTCAGMYAIVGANIPTAIGNVSITDSNIFAGLECMLADIDSIKLSGYDRAYSDNSYNDIFSNYNGLDSVYKYYQPIVKNYSPAIDSIFTERLQAARQALQTADSMENVNKQAYRSQYLYPLDTALKQVANIVDMQLP